jgi:putative SOS response-associated peptidase YedK
MCGRLDQSDIPRLIADFSWAESVIDRTEAEDSYNVAPGTYRPVLHVEGDQFAVDDLHWGYRSAWAEASGKIPMAINTRLEKISNSYWRGLLKNGRAIVPAFGWYEWTGEKGEKQPWHIHKRDRSPIYLAALANPGVKTDSRALHGFTIVTADAQGGLIDVHDRRPVVLNADAAAAWLDPATPAEMAEEIVKVAAVGPEAFAWYAIDRAIGNVRNQGSKLAEAIKL